jgi:hypothetical protein
MRLWRYKRAALAVPFGLGACLVSWLRPEGFIAQFKMPAYLFGAMVSANAHAPSEAAMYLAVWAQWGLIGYAVATVFLPRQARS